MDSSLFSGTALFENGKLPAVSLWERIRSAELLCRTGIVHGNILGDLFEVLARGY